METEDAITQMLVGALLESTSNKSSNSSVKRTLSLETLLLSTSETTSTVTAGSNQLSQFLPFCETPELNSTIATPSVHYHQLLLSGCTSTQPSPSPPPVVELSLSTLLYSPSSSETTDDHQPRPLLLANALALPKVQKAKMPPGIFHFPETTTSYSRKTPLLLASLLPTNPAPNSPTPNPLS